MGSRSNDPSTTRVGASAGRRALAFLALAAMATTVFVTLVGLVLHPYLILATSASLALVVAGVVLIARTKGWQEAPRRRDRDRRCRRLDLDPRGRGRDRLRDRARARDRGIHAPGSAGAPTSAVPPSPACGDDPAQAVHPDEPAIRRRQGGQVPARHEGEGGGRRGPKPGSGNGCRGDAPTSRRGWRRPARRCRGRRNPGARREDRGRARPADRLHPRGHQEPLRPRPRAGPEGSEPGARGARRRWRGGS